MDTLTQVLLGVGIFFLGLFAATIVVTMIFDGWTSPIDAYGDALARSLPEDTGEQ